MVSLIGTRGLRRGLVAVLAAGIMALGVAHATNVRAQAAPDDPVGVVEVRLSTDVSVMAQPDPASAVVMKLPANYVVDIVSRQIGKDGQLWAQIQIPGGAVVGWIPFSIIYGGSPLGPDGGQFDPTNPYGPGYGFGF